MEKHLFTTKDACTYLSISKPTLLRYSRLHGIKRTKFGKAVRWSVRELDRLVAIRSKSVR